MLAHGWLVFLLSSSALMAQRFGPAAARPGEIPGGAWWMISLADYDGDGDQDAAVTGSQFQILRHDTPTTWTSVPMLLPTIRQAAWADFDIDGDLDLLVGATNVPSLPSPFGILRNDPIGFTWLWALPTALNGEVTKCEVGDFTGDGLPDVVIGEATGVQVCRNLGNNVFGPPLVVSSLPNARPELFDRDNDGDLDLVVASTGGTALFTNVGGTFVPASGFTASGTDVVAADFDGDGRKDLAFASGGNVTVVWNDPAGWSTPLVVAPAVPEALEIRAGDLDRDGAIDLVVRTNAAVDWVKNTGSRTLQPRAGVTLGAPWLVRSMGLGDGASRGAVDVVVSFHNGEIRTLYGASPEPFLDPQALPGPSGLVGGAGIIAVGDVNGDGHLDRIDVGDREVLLGTGRGRYVRRPLPGVVANEFGAWLADLDGDGDLDLVVSGNMYTTVLGQTFVNDGLGNFTQTQTVPWFRICCPGDFDGDGDVDLFVPYGSGMVRWLRNTGGGQLVDTGIVPSIPQGLGGNDNLVCADFDGDGDLDVVSGEHAAGVTVRLNNGAGSFAAGAVMPVSPGTFVYRLKVGDFDGDGDVDLVTIESGQPALFRNSGAGAMVRVNGAFPTVQVSDLFSGDIDEDGDLDVLFYNGPMSLVTNDGTGQFQNQSAWLGSIAPANPLLFDTDEDGDVDIWSRFYGPPWEWRWFGNRGRGAESVAVVRPGGRMDVRFFHSPQAPNPNNFVAALASLAAGPSTALPGIRGRLLLDPAATMVLSVAPVPTGTVVMGFPIPPLVSLIGTAVSMQGLVLDANGLAFTNVVDERVLP